MNQGSVAFVERLDASQIARAIVLEVAGPGSIIVAIHGDDDAPRLCDLLVTSDANPPLLVPGDVVLVWAGPDRTSAVVIGRVGPSRGAVPEPEDVPETLTIEAKRSLTLRVGDGSITIREDGRVLIKGKDLVSHAQRMNRIKGGAVAIN